MAVQQRIKGNKWFLSLQSGFSYDDDAAVSNAVKDGTSLAKADRGACSQSLAVQRELGKERRHQLKATPNISLRGEGVLANLGSHSVGFLNHFICRYRLPNNVTTHQEASSSDSCVVTYSASKVWTTTHSHPPERSSRYESTLSTNRCGRAKDMCDVANGRQAPISSDNDQLVRIVLIHANKSNGFDRHRHIRLQRKDESRTCSPHNPHRNIVRLTFASAVGSGAIGSRFISSKPSAFAYMVISMLLGTKSLS